MGMKTFQHTAHISKRRYHELSDIQRWCRDNLGDGGYLITGNSKWYITTQFGESEFHFKQEQDLVLFALRWA
jgi:hypothetical protein